ncbi:hypothetical protein CEE37_06075 [candidate division LCP-89 bacterium B3_LCP]|uniref:Uncharacterized protein n=1 Tax=candidate division LCP-89 bacterium B3_LCP TaxID=2012998 RepID=A0A532V1Y0_UNCL8|nr:MAG: hypothetical protein CEE37_06075 [candidate division LCP-89 bacterium B3_LCP]
MNATMRVNPIVFIFIVFLTSLCTAQSSYNLYERQTALVGTGIDEARHLPDSILVNDSEVIHIQDSLLIREVDYRLDYVRGIIHFSGTLSVEDTARITYQVLPLNLRISYFNPILTIRPEEAATLDTLKSLPLPSESEFMDIGSLHKSGTLVRGITIGSDRDLSVESGLNLQVEGRLGKDVDVLALLSDENTPIQPEGNTATLQEIDKVLIEVQSTHFGATLGDYELQLDGPRFGSYYRKLQGGRLEGRTTDSRLTLSGAVSKGQYHSNFFYGEEGNQGPYPLTDEEGRTGILVLAGTERVWLDGERLLRGENNDYIIEYGLGEITFTPKRLITSDSRITVDFQYSAESYGRDIYAVQGESRFFDDRMGIRTTFISESDAKNNPLSFIMSEDNRAVISSAGDDPSLAGVMQVDSVAVGEGYYIREVVSIDSIFTYVGPDSTGYLNVIFSYVGQGNGDYKREAGASGFYYEWVGPGEGSYAPVNRLTLPERKMLADIEVWGNPTGTSQIKFEGAISDLDQNTLSGLDDGDNDGTAWAAKGSWQSSDVKKSGDFARFKVDAQVRDVDAQFSQIDRYQQVEYNRQWDLDEEASNEETVSEVAMTIRPISPWTSKIEYGLLDKPTDGFRSERWRGETKLLNPDLPLISAEADWIRSSSDAAGRTGFWTRGKSSAQHSFWRLTPSVSYEREHKHDDYADSLGGFLFNVYEAGLRYEAGKLVLETSQEVRDDQNYLQNKLDDHSHARTGIYHLELSNWRNLTTDFLFTHRDKEYQQSDSSATRTDLLEMNAGWTPFHRSVNLKAHYRINNTRVSTIVQTPVEVGPGQGTHTKIGDVYYEDPEGEYILIAQSTGEFEPVVELEGSASLDLDPHRLPKADQDNLPAPWKYLSSQTLLNFTEKTKEDDTWSLYLLDFSKFQKDSTLQGTFLLREDLFLFRHRRDLSFRLRGEISQSLSNLYLSGGQETKRKSASFRLRRSFNEKWSTQLDVGRETEQRVYRQTSASSRDILTWKGSLEPVFRPDRIWEIGLRIVEQLDSDRVENLKSNRYGLESRITRSFMQKGRAELRLDWHHVATSADVLPYEMAEGDPPGHNFRWDLRLDYRISKYLTATLSYNGNKEADRETIHIGQAEIRAFF